MNDTSSEIEQLQFEMMMKLGPAKRIELAAEMYLAARESVFASLPAGLSAKDRRMAFVQRIYGEKFADDFFNDEEK